MPVKPVSFNESLPPLGETDMRTLLMRWTGMTKARAGACARKLADLRKRTADEDLQLRVRTAESCLHYMRSELGFSEQQTRDLVHQHWKLLLLDRTELEKRIDNLRKACNKHFALFPSGDSGKIAWGQLLRQAPQLLAYDVERLERHFIWLSNLLKKTGYTLEVQSKCARDLLAKHPTLFAGKLQPLRCFLENRWFKYGDCSVILSQGKVRSWAVFKIELLMKCGSDLAAWLDEKSWKDICRDDDDAFGLRSDDWLGRDMQAELRVSGNITPAKGLARRRAAPENEANGGHAGEA